MWSRVESNDRPSELDTTSSKVYNYVRRNIEEKTKEEDGRIVTYYEFYEEKVNKEIWELYIRVSDLEDALCELSEEV